MGLWRYKFECNLLINFSILQHNAWYTLQYEPGRRLPVQIQQLEHVGNMFSVNNEDTGATPLSSCLIPTVFTPYSCAWVANFEQVVSCRDG